MQRMMWLVRRCIEDYRMIEPGDRIAQIVFAAVTRAELEAAPELGETERAAGGFGSTGKK